VIFVGAAESGLRPLSCRLGSVESPAR